jgi:predicted metal-binding membrane protein
MIAARRMSGMDGGPGTDPGALGFYLGTWSVMMAAMMLPSVMPALLRYSELRRALQPRGGSAHTDATGIFLAGYLAVWGVCGLAGYAVLEAGRSVDGGWLGWDRAGRWVAAGVLLLASVYQLTPAKSACLAQCRDARASLRVSLGEGHRGGLRSGMQHGVWCLGCCWALMAALFALGAMSVAWMALISMLIACERLLPWRRLATVSVASVLAALTIGVAAAPSRVPMLTIPGGSTAIRAMGMAPADHMRTGPPRTAELSVLRRPRLVGDSGVREVRSRRHCGNVDLPC